MDYVLCKDWFKIEEKWLHIVILQKSNAMEHYVDGRLTFTYHIN